MGDNIQTPHPRSISVLVIGANGYLGLAVCRAFLRAAAPTDPEHDDAETNPCPYRVYGLVRRPSAARDLSVNEVTPIVGELSDTENTLREILSHSPRWDVIVTCTEPAKTDSVAEAEHWNAIFKLIGGLTEASRCKDYGTTSVHGTLGLKPHTETSSLDAPPPIRGRTDAALKALEMAQNSHNGIESEGFDVAVIRATPIFGYSGSYFGAGFEYASRALSAKADVSFGEDSQALKFTADAGTILHSLHVDDCAEAYVALATTALLLRADGDIKKAKIAGEVFNISGRRYETLEEVGKALAAEYGFTGGARFGLRPDEVPGPANDMTEKIESNSNDDEEEGHQSREEDGVWEELPVPKEGNSPKATTQVDAIMNDTDPEFDDGHNVPENILASYWMADGIAAKSMVWALTRKRSVP
ncbi:hypothetical protein CkaCkLH20_00904 [Colletotrichum karsti]|uniref:NAD-dependent epimerase/dehydratase domain-containing protein n=1 Tax=Colletotrichum karsti TaxID=1095194 RepID=A0A9P6LQ07_9PEZI|nr:uncharacterized protein CkaCkLH20_00904 [Colletotrichum karsti]KAF9881758.1 hypothetical protein CkaCkLH20_00904 [Colletotrichum karsti]